MIELRAPYPTECVEFEGARFRSGGYGAVRFNGKTVRAHRLAYCMANGLQLQDIAGMEVRHKCDNPPCVNPAHLELGTHADNMRDMFSRSRRAAAKGSAASKAKLNEKLVTDIRRRLREGEAQPSIAADVGVDRSQISRIATGKTWRHVP